MPTFTCLAITPALLTTIANARMGLPSLPCTYKNQQVEVPDVCNKRSKFTEGGWLQSCPHVMMAYSAGQTIGSVALWGDCRMPFSESLIAQTLEPYLTCVFTPGSSPEDTKPPTPHRIIVTLS